MHFEHSFWLQKLSLHIFFSVAAVIFFGTLEFYGEFCEIEFFNSIQDWIFITVYRL